MSPLSTHSLKMSPISDFGSPEATILSRVHSLENLMDELATLMPRIEVPVFKNFRDVRAWGNDAQIQLRNQSIRDTRQRILGLQRKLGRLEQWTSSYLLDVASLNTPISILPPDILSHIFLIGLPRYRHWDRKYLLAISQVSKSWRDLSINTPLLWTRIDASWKYDLASVWLARANHRNIELYIDMNPYDRYDIPDILNFLERLFHSDISHITWKGLHILMDHFTDWECITLEILDRMGDAFGSSTSLETLTLIGHPRGNYYDVFNWLPNLRRVTLGWGAQIFIGGIPGPTITSLVSLRLHRLYIQTGHWLPMLRNVSQSLQTLEIHECEGILDHCSPVSLPALRNVALGAAHSSPAIPSFSISDMMSIFDAPGIVNLTILLNHPNFQMENEFKIASLIGSSRNLSRLHIGGTNVELFKLVNLMRLPQFMPRSLRVLIAKLEPDPMQETVHCFLQRRREIQGHVADIEELRLYICRLDSKEEQVARFHLIRERFRSQAPSVTITQVDHWDSVIQTEVDYDDIFN
ncbi:uncharacterized protein EI90DRAFT_3087923 [Cantharellus anzutake]|uniref:uncharacterized protein n=1 Tax=Cantharellus anzutake TaxID=1750568 RepID=UPI0019045D21|nr:uncharacterized protein EI90DRAFT_3087923 [Cantharellus anzutake]KAF8315757.1 hypothetical protein EI90DRAFT_3087923 [Cantharellus anzutake]